MISDAHDTRLPGACPKISWVILWVRFSANEYGGLRPSTGDCSFHVNDRSKTRAAFSVPTSASAERGCAPATSGSRSSEPPTAARAASRPAVPSQSRRERSSMSGASYFGSSPVNFGMTSRASSSIEWCQGPGSSA